MNLVVLPQAKAIAKCLIAGIKNDSNTTLLSNQIELSFFISNELASGDVR